MESAGKSRITPKLSIVSPPNAMSGDESFISKWRGISGRLCWRGALGDVGLHPSRQVIQ